MTKSRRRDVDPFEREIEIALEPGGFIADRACLSFVSGLDEVAATIANLISTEPARAVRLYETFLAGCYEKAEELDDSSGSFGQFVKDLYCGWIQARQAAGAELADGDLSRLRRVLLSKLGRGGEALESAWAEYRR